MKRFVIVVLDGYGIGAMDDVPELRPLDRDANTARHIFESVPGLRLPTLASLGLGNAMLAANPALILPDNLAAAQSCIYGVHKLAHCGADTFWGHQELMGTKPKKGESAPILPRLPEIREALEKAGHRVRFYTRENENNRPCPGILIVDEAVTIGDNLETDLGDNYNVTAALDLIPFEKVRETGVLVRSLVRSSRVIVFGGLGVGLNDLLNAYESRNGFAGINAPHSGVYSRGYQVVHLGYGVNSKVQVPAILEKAGIPTVLIGKVADIVENHGKNIPGVDTAEVLAETARVLDSLEQGFVCVNVQETDLAGHREDPGLYAEKLMLADRGIRDIMDKLGKNDIIVVTADHGNDPLIGHPRHTREKTPVLVWGPELSMNLPKEGNYTGSQIFLGERASLADTGAGVTAFFNAPPPEAGIPYLKF